MGRGPTKVHIEPGGLLYANCQAAGSGAGQLSAIPEAFDNWRLRLRPEANAPDEAVDRKHFRSALGTQFRIGVAVGIQNSSRCVPE